MNVIRLNVDTDVSVPITNPRRQGLTVEITSATLTAKLKDGTARTVSGTADATFIPAGGSGMVRIRFLRIPVIFEVKTDPLALVPLIERYDVAVRYKGEVKLFGFIPVGESGVVSRAYKLSDISLDENQLKDQILQAFR